MFKVGDIVRQKSLIRGDNKVYYALIIRIDGEHNEHSTIKARRITAQWLNWDGEIPIITLYEHEAKNWWMKVE